MGVSLIRVGSMFGNDAVYHNRQDFVMRSLQFYPDPLNVQAGVTT